MTAAKVIAIDGAAGSGKSTLARGLADALRLPYVNTGLMYRALAAAALRGGVSPGDAPRLDALTRGLRYTLEGSHPAELMVEGWTIQELTTPDVERTVSEVSCHPSVRALMRDAQRALGGAGAVMEGRDIGSVVFPDAALKLFLRADPAARVRRRAEERGTAEETRDDLIERDRRDARTNPLEAVPDAVVLDTSLLDVSGTLAEALRIVRELAPELSP